MKKFLVLIFSLFIFSECYAENCSLSTDCYSPIGTPTILRCSSLVMRDFSGTCRYLCTTNASYVGTECECDPGYGGDGTTTCEQCTAGNYGPNSSNACVACPTDGGSAGTSAAGSDAITDCYKTYVVVSNGHLSGTCYYSTGTSSYANMVTGICDLTCNSGYHVSGALCVENTITISYNVNTGTGSAASTTCTYGGTCNLSAGGTMSKTGYTLTNWCTSSSGGTCYALGSSHPELAIPNTNITLYAKWTANTITANYAGNGSDGGTAPASQTFSYNDGTTASDNTYSKTGYTFTGWLCSGGNTSCDGDIISAGTNISTFSNGGTITLTAQWVADTFLLIVDPNNSDPSSAITCTVGTPCNFSSSTPSPAPSGYTFLDWNTENDGSGTASYTSPYTFPDASVTTLYARWKKTITFNGNGGTPASQTVDCYHGGYLTVPAIPSTAPLVFHRLDTTNWYSNPNGITGTNVYTAGSSTLLCDNANTSTVYPKWNYTITYNGGNCPTTLGGTVPASNAGCIKGTQNCPLANIPTLTCSGGYVLDTTGWNSSSLGTGTNYAFGLTTFNNSTGSPAGDIILYAKWIACSAGQWADNTTHACVDCTAGHYCPLGSTSPSNCPMGHTSDITPTLPDDITDCYIASGTGETQFCDSNGCFNLPAAIGNIYWH